MTAAAFSKAKSLERVRTGNSNLLELEDVVFPGHIKFDEILRIL